MTKCLLPLCPNPLPPPAHGRPRDYCTDAHRHIAARFFQHYLRHSGLLRLLAHVIRAAILWRLLQRGEYDYDRWCEFRAAMDAITAHPLVGSRAAPSRPAVPSSDPLPGAAQSEIAGQGGGE